eukprot:GEMP01001495.1.p1 GENE.GEMP01001495.1~~GEMP01001495.1.p1  ORF type:complete len:1042 (+),score=197.84 GEMP01001495.1:242-3367(+)
MKLVALCSFAASVRAQQELPMGRLDTCEGVEKELSACNTKECPEAKCVDCRWNEWEDWGMCSCTGLTERQRQILKTNNYCGKPCEGSKVETRTCHPSCFKTVEDCQFSPWSEWEKCSRECGGGQTIRKRAILSSLEADGAPCEGNTREIQTCNTQVCNSPMDCEVTEWEEHGKCSATCGGGQQDFIRHIKTQSKFGGKPCTAELTKLQACNAETCSDVTDCLWNEWQSWSACSRTCGSGEKSRSRLIKIAPRDGGKLCDPLDMGEVAACSTQPCVAAEDCKLGPWSKWDACSCECNGVQNRARRIEKYPKMGGKACEGPLEEIKGCNMQCDHGKNTVHPTHAPANCAFSKWSDWTECSRSCGAGDQTRTRTVVDAPELGGLACNDDLEMVRSCNTDACSESEASAKAKNEQVMNCTLSSWDAWGTCTASCGGGERQRQRKVEIMPSKHGKPCDHIAIRESMPCNIGPCDCVSCKWGLWSEWGACTCTGLKERHRGIEQHFQNCGDVCSGVKTATASCTPECATESANCDLSEWSKWSQCSVTCGGGQVFRQRGVRTQPKNGGHTCADNLRETKSCNTNKCAEGVDCELSDWSHWDQCSATCGGGQQSRSRMLEIPPALGGKGCSDALSETRGCGAIPCVKPVDCLWTEWSDWAACTATCSGGQKSRDRDIKISPRNGGRLCDALSMTEIAGCNKDPCPRGCVDGQLTVWSEWSVCSASCDVGFQARHRQVSQEPNHCGKPIGLDGTAELQQFAACDLEPCTKFGVDCAFSEWSSYGDCSCSTDGTRDRSRVIQTYQSNGGKACAGSMKQVEPCNIGAGAPNVVDCELSAWAPWQDCSRKCDGGVRMRHRTVEQAPSGGGKPCEDRLSEVEGCNNHPCKKPIDCVWSKWTDWGGCSVHCGGGQRNRYRHVVTTCKNGGKECKAADSVEVKGCNMRLCHETNYCQWDKWTSWTVCSKTCGSGQMSRERNLIKSTIHHEAMMEALDISDLNRRFTSDHLLMVFMAGVMASAIVFIMVTYAFRRYRNYRPEFLPLLANDNELTSM